MIFCNKCGREIPDGSDFCPHCGCPVPSEFKITPEKENTPPAANPYEGHYHNMYENPYEEFGIRPSAPARPPVQAPAPAPGAAPGQYDYRNMYGAPAANYGAPAAPAEKKSSSAPLILGILGIVIAWFFALAGHVLSIIGIVLGVKEYKKTGKISGMIVSIVGELCSIASSVIGIVLYSGLTGFGGLNL